MIVWSILVTLLSLSGNSTVLISSIKYNAIKLDKISVVLIRNIAVADLGSTLFVVIPTIGSVAADRWIYGTTLCFLLSYMVWVFSIANNLLIATLNCSKLLCLLFPFRARVRTQSAGRKISLVIWSITIIYLLLNVILRRPCAYETFIDRCNIQSTTPFWARFDFASSLIFATIPLLVILISTIWLLFFVKSRGRLCSGNLALVLSVSIVYLISLGPFIVYQIGRLAAPGFYAFSIYVYYVSTVSNPLLYYLSSSSFKEFVRNMVSGVRERWRRYGGGGGERGGEGGGERIGEVLNIPDSEARTITELCDVSVVVTNLSV